MTEQHDSIELQIIGLIELGKYRDAAKLASASDNHVLLAMNYAMRDGFNRSLMFVTKYAASELEHRMETVR